MEYQAPTPAHDTKTPPDEGPMMLHRECTECFRADWYEEDAEECRYCGGELIEE